ncbi:MAG: 30S ribosomal protein S20 [Patescibacteria group bacterium]|jgi:ribosomal protein S20
MPILKNAEKALRKSKVRGERNADAKSKIAYMRRNLRKLIEAKKFTEADEVMKGLVQSLDKAVTQNLMKRNTVDRIKSRAMLGLAKARK